MIRVLAIAWTDGRHQATNNDPSDPIIGITVFLQMIGDRDEHARRKGHVEHSVVLLPVLLEFLQMLSEIHKGLILIILSWNVTAEIAKVGQLLLHLLGRSLDMRFHSLEVFLTIHLRPRISHNLGILRKEFVPMQTEKSREGLLLGQVPGCTQDHDDSVLLQLNGTIKVEYEC